MLQVITTAYGRPASACLHETVRRAKGGDPLAPVTVVVPTNSVGVAARRLLAGGALGGLTEHGDGVVGVTFLTVFRLAELLGASRLAGAGRRPVSTPVVAAALRTALAGRRGPFTPVAAHPATEEALVAASRELAELDDDGLGVLAAQSPRAREVVRLHRATRAALAVDWYDERDLMQAAGEAVAAGSPLLHDLGAIICFLPQRWGDPAARLLAVLASVADVTVIAGLTGVPAADAAVRASIERVGGRCDDAAPVTPPLGTAVITASDADDEIRAVVRGVVDAMRDGVPLERMAVCYGSHEPYARLVHEHLDRAGIAHNGVAVRSLAESVLGRALLQLLHLGAGTFRREEVCALFSAAPLIDGAAQPIPASAWERISRKAGVVAGIDEWRTRLDGYAASLADAAVADDASWAARERDRAQRLRAFVDTLAAEVMTRPASWAGFARLAHRLISRFVGADHRRERWPQIEQDAARRVESAVDRLGTLDAVDVAPTAEVFLRTLRLELDGATERVGRLGQGLLAGPIGLALGVELDRLWVCGLAEGVFPSVPNDDPLLADAERSALGGELRLRHEYVDELERMFLAAMAATAGARVCTYPRGDLRRSSERVPSRFVEATLAATGSPQHVASFTHGLTTVVFPATPHERAVVGALAGEEWVRESPAVARGRALLAGRGSAAFTRFDGNLAGVADLLARRSPLEGDRPVSPTQLETWAGCPHAYFMQYLLHVRPIERPEEIFELSPLDLGSIVHDVLDRFLSEGPRDAARLRGLAEEACDDAEARGITGRRLLWHRDRRRVLAYLDAFFVADERWRAERGATTVATELPFGMGAAADAVELTFVDGRRLRLRGKADRIDRASDGSLLVIDYKTGKRARYDGLGADDPVLGGSCLQLPVYARAARAAFGDDGTPVSAYYWFVGPGNDAVLGYAVVDAIDDVFADTVRAIADAIESGVFVAVPPPPSRGSFVQCPYCDPDGLGTADRWREWERKQVAPELLSCAALGLDNGSPLDDGTTGA